MGYRLTKTSKGLLALTLVGAVTSALIACSSSDNGAGSSGTTVPDASPTATVPDASPTSTVPPPPDSGPPDSGPSQTLAAPTFTPAPGSFTSSVPGGVTIAAIPADATIYFTTDGTNPTSASVVYSGAISIATTTTIRAMASKTGFNNSPVAAGVYTINPPAAGQLSDVSINPTTGTYPNPQSVGLSVPVAEQPATVCYTLDGSNPTCNAATATCTGTAATYSAGAPLQVDAPVGGGATRVRAIACKVGQKTSVNISESSLSFKAADPTATLPGPSEVAPGTQITLQTVTAGAGANVHYRIDGAAPNCLAGVGGGELACGGSACLVTINENTTIRAIACKPNYTSSALVSFAYTVRVATSTLTPAAIYYNDITPGTVAATRGNGAPVVPTTTCWTTGATMPVCNAAGDGCTTGNASNPAGNVTADNTQVNVIGCKASAGGIAPGGFTPSIVTSANYRLMVDTISVTPSPGGGVYSPGGSNALTATNYWNNGTSTSFTLDSSTTDTGGNPVRIRYRTTAGAAPSCAGAVGAGVTEVGKGASIGSPAPFTTIRAIGCKTLYQDSAPRTLTYQDPLQAVVLDPVPPPTTSSNNIAVNLTSTPAAGPLATDTHICYALGQAPVATPDCDPLGTPAAITGSGPWALGLCSAGSVRYNPAVGSRPVVSETGFEIKAIACKTGVPQKSNVVSQIFTLKMAPTVFTDSAVVLPAGNILGANIPYNSVINFHSPSEASKPGVQYRWTTDGVTNPTCTTGSGPATSTTFLPATNAAVTYKVIACDPADAWLPSDIATFAFSGFLSPPTFTPNGGTNANLVSTTINSSNPGGYLCYTDDLSTPACIGGGTCTGTKIANFTGVVNITTDPTTLKATACRNTGFAGSAVTTSNVFRLIVGDPLVTPAGGPQVTPVTIGITNGATDTANVCWTIDGADIAANCTSGGVMTCQSRNGGVALTSLPPANKATNFTLKARACRAGFASSALVANTYTFSPYSRTIVIDGFDDWQPPENLLPAEGTENGGYLSWDANYVYFGWRGSELQDLTTRYFGVYLRSPAGPYTTTRDDRLGADKFGQLSGGSWGMMPQPTGGVDYHFYVRTDRNENPGASQWNGANWVASAAAITCAHGGALNTVSALVECRIARADVGLGGANAPLILNGVISNDTSGAHNEWPYVGGEHHFFSGNMSTNIPSDPALRPVGVLP